MRNHGGETRQELRELKNGGEMTRARAAEILYESLKNGLMDEGEIDQERHSYILENFLTGLNMDIPKQEIVDLVEFIKNDVNKSIKGE